VNRSGRTLLNTLGRTVLSLVLLVLLAYLFRTRLGQAFRAVSQAQVWWLVIAIGWFVVFIIVSAWRWQVLLGAAGLRFSTWYLSKVFTLGLFFCKLLPTSIGGDVFRIAYTARKDKGMEAFSATFLDRLIGFLSLTFLAVLVALALFATRAQTRTLEITVAGRGFRGFGIVGLLLATLVGLLLLTLLLFNDRAQQWTSRLLSHWPLGIGRLLDKAYAAVKQFRTKHWALATSFVSGIGVQAALSLCWYCVARSIGGTVPLVYYFILIPLLNIVVNLPTIGGLGVREWAFVLFFTPDWLTGHLTQEQALATALLFLILDLGFALLGGVLFAVLRRGGSAEAASASVTQWSGDPVSKGGMKCWSVDQTLKA